MQSCFQCRVVLKEVGALVWPTLCPTAKLTCYLLAQLPGFLGIAEILVHGQVWISTCADEGQAELELW